MHRAQQKQKMTIQTKPIIIKKNEKTKPRFQKTRKEIFPLRKEEKVEATNECRRRELGWSDS